MTGAKFYPQHKDKCYCRLHSNAVGNNFVQSNNFVKTKSVKYQRNDKASKYEPLYDNFEKSTCKCCKVPLNYSPQRYNYELNEKPLYERNDDLASAAGFSPKSNGYSASRCSSVDLLLKNFNDEKINQIGEFRSNNSSDCISISNKMSIDRKKREMLRDAQSHICNHRFVLNDRLQPIPVHKDKHGSSTCVKCSKILLELKPFDVKNRLITSDKNAASTVTSAGQEPILILEVQMDKDDEKSKMLKKLSKRVRHAVSVQSVNGVQPNNSFALRFQNKK